MLLLKLWTRPSTPKCLKFCNVWICRPTFLLSCQRPLLSAPAANFCSILVHACLCPNARTAAAPPPPPHLPPLCRKEGITDKVMVEISVEEFRSVGLNLGDAKLVKKEIDALASPATATPTSPAGQKIPSHETLNSYSAPSTTSISPPAFDGRRSSSETLPKKEGSKEVCKIELVSGYKSVSCGPQLLAPLSVLKPDRPAPGVMRLVAPYGQVCWVDESISKCNADDLHSCKVEVDDCTLRTAALNRLTTHVTDSAQFPPSTSLAVFLTGVLKQGKTLDETLITVLASSYGIDDVYFFVHVWPEPSKWEGSHDPLQLKSDIETWFQLKGLKKLQYHVMVDSIVQPSTCEGDKAWERCEANISKCDLCFQFCTPWTDVMLTRFAQLWDRVVFVESNRRSRFAFVMRLRTHTIMSSMLPYSQLRSEFGVASSAMGHQWPHNDFWGAYELLHDEFWMTTRDLADLFFKNVHTMRVLSYYEETLQMIRVPEEIRLTRPLHNRTLSNSDGLEWNTNKFKWVKALCMNPGASNNYFEFAIDIMTISHPFTKKMQGVVNGIKGYERRAQQVNVQKHSTDCNFFVDVPCCNMGARVPASNYQDVCVLVSVPQRGQVRAGWCL
jgi:hypothetical protein